MSAEKQPCTERRLLNCPLIPVSRKCTVDDHTTSSSWFYQKPVNKEQTTLVQMGNISLPRYFDS